MRLTRYLKGAPAPEWLKNGIPRVKMEEHLLARKDSLARLLGPQPVSAAAATKGGGN